MAGDGAPDPALRRALLAGAGVVTAVWFAAVALIDEAPFALTFDDAYYYAAIARNLARGAGSTFDGINPTNGYHPLWMAVSVVPFRLGLDDLDAVRALLLVQVLAWGLALVLVGRLVAEVVGPVRPPARGAALAVIAATFTLVGLSPFVVKTFVNGMETGVGVALLAAVLLVAVRHPDPAAGPRGAAVVLGVLLAAAFLARTDAAVLVAAAGLWTLPGAVRARRPARLALVVGPAAVTAVGYLALNQRWFGSPWQVSGLIKRAPVDARAVATMAALGAVAALLAVHGWRRSVRARPPRRADPRFPRAGRCAAATAWFGAAALVLVGYYQVLQTQQWLWYFAPVVLWLVVLFVLAVADVAVAAQEGDPARAPARVAAVGGLVFVLPLLAGLVVQGRAFADPTVRSIQLANRDAGRWIDANLPPGAVLASWDAGVVGYFAHRPVVNLDGVVNSHAWYEALRAGTDPAVLRCEGVGWVVNHGAGATGDDPDIVAMMDRTWGAGAGGPGPVHVEPFRYSGTSNAGGLQAGDGLQDEAVRLYRVDPARVGPRAGDRCP
jgi:hypothetical protein